MLVIGLFRDLVFGVFKGRVIGFLDLCLVYVSVRGLSYIIWILLIFRKIKFILSIYLLISIVFGVV